MNDRNGIERRMVDGAEAIVTKGAAVGDEAIDGEWRVWDPNRSKLAAMIEVGLPVTLSRSDSVLYLGAAGGTTVSHVADVAGPTYAIEFAPRPMRRLLGVAEERPNLFPLLKDARAPETYAHVVESDLTTLVQDVATRGQGSLACANRRFLADDATVYIAIKARSEDVTADPSAVYDDVLDDLAAEYDVIETASLEPYHVDHLGVIASPKSASDAG